MPRKPPRTAPNLFDVLEWAESTAGSIRSHRDYRHTAHAAWLAGLLDGIASDIRTRIDMVRAEAGL